MTKSYSLDLRQRVARFVEAGHSRRAAARHFEVSVAFVTGMSCVGSRVVSSHRQGNPEHGRRAGRPNDGLRARVSS